MGNKKNDVIDLDFSVMQKKRFRIDKDNNRILELNTSDMNIIARLEESYPKIDSIVEQVSAPDDEANVDVKALKKLDDDLRTLIDYIFDSKVSEVCAPDGSMYDLFNGQFRFEHIFEVLFGLYEDNINREYKKLTTRVNKHTDKYTKSKK